MTSGASCTWSQLLPQAPTVVEDRVPGQHRRARPGHRPAVTVWTGHRRRRHHGPSRPPGSALPSPARPARARRGRRRRTAGCHRCRSGMVATIVRRIRSPSRTPVATYVASRPRAAYRISAKGRSASTTSGSPRSSPSSHSPATDSRASRRRRGRRGVRRGSRARGRRSAPDQQPAHHPDRRLAPSPHQEETRGPSTLLSDDSNPLWTRGSEAGGTVGGRCLDCPMSSTYAEPLDLVERGLDELAPIGPEFRSTGERQEFLLRRRAASRPVAAEGLAGPRCLRRHRRGDR